MRTHRSERSGARTPLASLNHQRAAHEPTGIRRPAQRSPVQQTRIQPRDSRPAPAERSPSPSDSARATGPDFAEMMARYLGGRVMQAFADDDVTELYVNPQD